ncbi:hypothetical protein PFISCL1PPCAC_28415, partial [Pristionchus fissidentatus]
MTPATDQVSSHTRANTLRRMAHKLGLRRKNTPAQDGAVAAADPQQSAPKSRKKNKKKRAPDAVDEQSGVARPPNAKQRRRESRARMAAGGSSAESTLVDAALTEAERRVVAALAVEDNELRKAQFEGSIVELLSKNVSAPNAPAATVNHDGYVEGRVVYTEVDSEGIVNDTLEELGDDVVAERVERLPNNTYRLTVQCKDAGTAQILRMNGKIVNGVPRHFCYPKRGTPYRPQMQRRFATVKLPPVLNDAHIDVMASLFDISSYRRAPNGGLLCEFPTNAKCDAFCMLWDGLPLFGGIVTCIVVR